MSYKITIKNYRCFTYMNPLVIFLEEGCSTAFTGINNVGKSVPLKFFWEFRNLFTFLGNPDTWENTYNDNSIGMSFHGTKDDIEVFNNSNELGIEILIELSADKARQEISLFKIEISRKIQDRACDFRFSFIAGSNHRERKIFSTVRNNKAEMTISGKFESNDIVIVSYANVVEFSRSMARSLYVGAFRNAINNTGIEYYDLKVGTEFIKQWASWQNGYLRDNQMKIMVLIEEIAELLDLKNLNIQASNDSLTLNVTYNRKIYRLEELGSGISQVIIILGNVLLKSPSLILIDEPEMNLHPRLQVRFLALIEKYSQYLIYSTHSIGLARSFTDNVQLLKREDEVIQIDLAKPNSCLEFAGELYYGAMSQIGCNKVLLCEGPTDLKIFQHFLKDMGFGNQFLIIPLYGRNQINSTSSDYLEEINKLNIPVYAIIDSERISAQDIINEGRIKFSENCKKLLINCHILERRALENYLSENAIQLCFGKAYKGLSFYQDLKSLKNQAWNKNQNWKIASHMKFKDIVDTDLGSFLSVMCSE